MRDLAEININFGGKPVERDAPTPEIISAFEREFDLSIPKDYASLLIYSNGGHPEWNLIDPLGGSALAGESVSDFFHLDEDQQSLGGLWKKTRLWQLVLGARALPVADDSFGNVYYLDLTTNPAKVKFCAYTQNFAIFEVAPSFSDFIDSLQFDPDMI